MNLNTKTRSSTLCANARTVLDLISLNFQRQPKTPPPTSSFREERSFQLLMARSIPSASPAKKSVIPTPRNLPEECSLLRIFLGEGDEYQHRPLYRAILLKTREVHLARATVLRG